MSKEYDYILEDEEATLADGLKLTTSRAFIFKTVSTIRSVLNFISISMPLIFAAFYIFFMINGETGGHKFVINCIMLPLVIAELVINSVLLIRQRKRKNVSIEKKGKKILYYAKFSLSIVTCAFAVYQALTYESTLIQLIMTSVMLAFLFVRMLFEILKISAEKYFNMMLLAVAMDLKKVVNKKTIRTAGAVAGAISNPKLAAVNAFDKIVQKIADRKNGGENINEEKTEEKTEEPTFFDKYIDRANSNDKSRIYLSRLASEYKEQNAAENFKKQQEKDAELKKRKDELKEHIFSAIGKK